MEPAGLGWAEAFRVKGHKGSGVQVVYPCRSEYAAHARGNLFGRNSTGDGFLCQGEPRHEAPGRQQRCSSR